MSHQFQTQVLVDGVWTTRTVDTFDALARQSAPQVETKTKEPEIKNVEYLPGVLTKTLLSTPHTKFILPVKIRHGFINDVVFIGEYAVHLKEIQPDGSLRHIASMIDFRDRIIAAKVLSTSQANQEDAEYNDPVKKEDLATGSDAKRMSAVHMIPPEVIVLVLDSCDLMFLWTLQSEAGDIKFRHTAWRMPKTKHDQPGSLLAVDPKSRAIAVAYGERKFMLYKLKPVEEWQNELLGWAKTPIEEERQIRLSISNQEQHSGSPMHMDFLASRDDSHIVLLLVLAHRGWTKISCYDWDARCRLNTVTPRAERLSVDFGEHLPRFSYYLGTS